MAFIFIKRRKEPIDISPERAYKIKCRWLGIDGVEKADPTDTVDIGSWAGEYSQILSIEIPKDRKPVDNVKFDTSDDTFKKEEMRLLAMPIEDRAKLLDMFEIRWFMRSGMTEKIVPQDVIEQAKALAYEYFKNNPLSAFVPLDVFEPLLAMRWGVKKGR